MLFRQGRLISDTAHVYSVAYHLAPRRDCAVIQSSAARHAMFSIVPGSVPFDVSIQGCCARLTCVMGMGNTSAGLVGWLTIRIHSLLLAN